MAGMCDLGGVKFYTLAVDTPNGDLALMDAVLEGGMHGCSRGYQQSTGVRTARTVWLDFRCIGCL